MNVFRLLAIATALATTVVLVIVAASTEPSIVDAEWGTAGIAGTLAFWLLEGFSPPRWPGGGGAAG